jgi:histone H3/H4
MDIAKYTVHKVMKKAGAKKVSLEAAELLARYLEKVAVEITKQAVRLAEEAGRITVKERDIRLVLEIRGEEV